MSIEFDIELLKEDVWKMRNQQRTVPVIARRCNISTTTINSLIHKNRAVTMSTFVKICNYLGTRPQRYFKYER